MIAVIADDFTGAAELAGVGLRYHLTVELGTVVNKATKADLFIIATDARSMTEEQAVQEMKKHAESLLALQPSLLFKKTDSVLRGHILAELVAQLSVTGFERSVLVAANPHLGRTIQHGRYFLHGQPIHETSFSHDPEFAITSSAVEDMLRSKGHPVHIKKPHEPLPQQGIIVGEATQIDDLKTWAARIDSKTLAAGAAGFFSAILYKDLAGTGALEGFIQDLKVKLSVKPAGLSEALFVCGTTFDGSRNAIQKIHAKGGPVSYMPQEVIQSVYAEQYSYVKWANEVVALVKKHGKAIVAIQADSTKNISVRPDVLRDKMAGLVNEVLRRSMIQELVIEGGATAWAVIQRSGIRQFFPVEEMAPGVVRMQAPDAGLHMIVKPGSYQWPGGLWDF